MAEKRVTDFSLFINHQIQVQEQIETYLWRLEALIAVTVIADFHDLPKSILHSYFSVMSDLVEEAEKVNQASLNDLLKHER